MAIYDPIPGIDADRQRLLALLCQLLEDAANHDRQNRNYSSGLIPLSAAEKVELCTLLASVAEQREIHISLSFVDGILGIQEIPENALREIYLSERKRRGRTRTLASMHWADFQARFGRLTWRPRWGPTLPMSFGHFLKMEDRLFRALHFPMRVRQEIITKVASTREMVEGIRDTTIRAQLALEDSTLVLAKRLRDGLAKIGDEPKLKRNQIIGLSVVLANTSVMFTTRDWSAAGTISAISGGLVQTTQND